jgi:hypothetical protein
VLYFSNFLGGKSPKRLVPLSAARFCGLLPSKELLNPYFQTLFVSFCAFCGEIKPLIRMSNAMKVVAMNK